MLRLKIISTVKPIYKVYSHYDFMVEMVSNLQLNAKLKRDYINKYVKVLIIVILSIHYKRRIFEASSSPV